jgi:hypothetical protein
MRLGGEILHDLEKAVEEGRLRRLTEEEKQEQRLSFAYGNTKIENDLITRETVAEQAALVDREARNADEDDE